MARKSLDEIFGSQAVTPRKSLDDIFGSTPQDAAETMQSKDDAIREVLFNPEQAAQRRAQLGKDLQGAILDFDTGYTGGWGKKTVGRLGGAIGGGIAGVVNALNGGKWSDIGTGIVEGWDNQSELRNIQKEYDEAHPIASGAIKIAGGLTNPLVRGSTKLAAQALENTAKYGNVISKAANLGTHAVTGSGIGLITGAGESENAINYLKNGDIMGDAIAGSVGNVLLPAGAAIARPLSRGLGGVAKLGLAKTTGVGSEALERAFDAGVRKSKVFLDNMRGKVAPENVVGHAKQEISNMIEGNNDLYRATMDKAFSDTTKLDTGNIMAKFRDISNKTTAGGMKSARGEEKKVLKEINEYLKPYRQNKELHTTQWLDDLRQDIYSIKTDPGTKAHRLKKQMENIIKDTISEQRPEYREGLRIWARNKSEIEELQRVFSLNDRASLDTALRKIQSLGRNNVQTNYGYRNALMDKLDFSGNIRDAASGQMFNTWIPRGLQAGAVGGVNIYNAAINPVMLPQAIAYAAASSPRVVGEVAYKAGMSATRLKALLDYLEKSQGLAGSVSALRSEK